jgi:Lon protease-like protein
MPFRLPIFPLSVVLFPGTPLPLHIFESRYRRMVTDCLAGDRKFGITPAGTTRELPDPGTVGCVAEIRVHQELPDGRSNLVVLGGTRFRLGHPVEESTPYHVAMVDPFEEEPGTDPPADELERLRAMFIGYIGLLRQLNDVEPEEPSLPDDSLSLTFHIAAAVECEVGIKQRLLVERSTARRTSALLLLIPILTSALESALKVHHRAHTNGRAGRAPNLLTDQ